MDKTFIHHLKQILQPLFPARAHIRGQERESSFVVAIDWPLKKDKERPHKRSRVICILLPVDLMENYSHSTELLKMQLDKHLLDFIQKKLAAFNPDHAAVYGEIPPTEEWLFDMRNKEK